MDTDVAEKYIITRTFTDGHGQHRELELEKFEYRDVIKRKGQYQWVLPPPLFCNLSVLMPRCR